MKKGYKCILSADLLNHEMLLGCAIKCIHYIAHRNNCVNSYFGGAMKGYFRIRQSILAEAVPGMEKVRGSFSSA
jgi:hypothetical protein